MKIEVVGARVRESAKRAAARVEEIARELGTRYSVQFSLPTGESDKLGWFNDGRAPHQPARPVWPSTPEVDAAVRAAIKERIRVDLAASGRINKLLALRAGADAFRAAWVRRLTLSGAEMRWSPLSPRYARWKHARGLDPRIGVATGAMLAAVRAGLIVIRRIA